MEFLTISNLEKRYGPEAVLQGASFGLAEGETLSVLGPSGCGKTTLLKILAGLESADGGEIWLKGQRVDAWPPQRRGMIYLKQQPLLFPHLDVLDNVAFGLRLRGLPAAQRRQQAAELLDALGLVGQAHKRPEQLSGGQQQRVAFARALILRPPLLLLDEPFAALDGETRRQMQDFYAQTAARYGISSILVTHDLREALRMGQRIGSMAAGRLHIHASVAAFVASEPAVQREVDFWKSLTR